MNPEKVEKLRELTLSLSAFLEEFTPKELEFFRAMVDNFSNYEKTHPKIGILGLQFPEDNNNLEERNFDIELLWNDKINEIADYFEKNFSRFSAAQDRKKFVNNFKEILTEMNNIQSIQSQKILDNVNKKFNEIL